MDTTTDDNEHAGAAPELHLVPVWVFRLGKRDSLLVLKALGGRLGEREIEEARALGDRLTELRAMATTDLHTAASRALDGVRKARAEGAP